MLEGIDQLYNLATDLGEAPRKVQARAGLALDKAVRDIEGNAKALAPVDTGFLQSSISHTVTSSGTTLRGEVGPTANYAAYVENGTRTQRAQPYLRPATDRVIPAYEAALAQLTEGIL